MERILRRENNCFEAQGKDNIGALPAGLRTKHPCAAKLLIVFWPYDHKGHVPKLLEGNALWKPIQSCNFCMLCHYLWLMAIQKACHMWPEPWATLATHSHSWCNHLAAAHQASDDTVSQPGPSMQALLLRLPPPRSHQSHGLCLVMVFVVMIVAVVTVVLRVSVPWCCHSQVEPTTGSQPGSGRRRSHPPPPPRHAAGSAAGGRGLLRSG